MKESFQHQKNFKQLNSKDYEKSILCQKRFNEFLELSLQCQDLELKVSSHHKKEIYQPDKIQDELARMRCTHKKKNSQFAFYLANKIIHRLVTGLHLDLKGI